MFSYLLIESGPFAENGPLVQILFEDNVIDESGPWESASSAANWAQAYVGMKNSGIQEPQI
jgi:hypothetical protein